MAKSNNNEVTVARIMYVEGGKTQKEIAQKLQRTEKTIGAWALKYGWKNERTARINSVKNQESQVNEILNHYAAQSLELLEELKREKQVGNNETCLELNKKLTAISDDVSKWNKRLESLNKENKATLSTYLYVMDDIFEAMRAFDQKLYNKSLSFQEEHLQKISLKLS